MTSRIFSNSTPQQHIVPELEEIEGMLRTYRPNPGSQLADKVAELTWMSQTSSLDQYQTPVKIPFFNQKRAARWALGFLSVLFLILLLTFTNIGQIAAQSISRFFKISTVNYVREVVSTTPLPTASSNLPYDQYTLSIEQAEAQAGFNIKSLATLPSADWVFHGAKYEPETRGISLFYSLPDREFSTTQREDIYLYITAQKSEFEDSRWWGECPKSVIIEVKVNNWPAELADGASWETDTKPTPGVERVWICRVTDPGTTMNLRWDEPDLKYNISVAQMGLNGEGADMTIPWLDQQDLINLAENLK
jgi:hypothetical protein